MKVLLCAYGDAGLDALRVLVSRKHTVLLVRPIIWCLLLSRDLADMQSTHELASKTDVNLADTATAYDCDVHITGASAD